MDNYSDVDDMILETLKDQVKLMYRVLESFADQQTLHGEDARDMKEYAMETIIRVRKQAHETPYYPKEVIS